MNFKERIIRNRHTVRSKKLNYRKCYKDSLNKIKLTSH